VSKEMKERYEIDEDTRGIVPYLNPDGYLWSKVIEESGIILVKKPPLSVIKDSCYYYGSTYEGKKEAARLILGRCCFAPIMIDSRLDLCFFPTESPQNETCIWLSQPHVLSQEKAEAKRSLIIFSNGMELPVASTISSIKNKLHRAAHYRSIINSRTKKRERKRGRITLT
jgi:competence protein ComK